MDGSRRRPWLKFYPADWQADDGLRQCGLAARGLWIELIAIMHKSESPGHLLIAGAVPSVKQIAAAVGADQKDVAAGLAQLERWRVFSRRPNDNAIFSRRMVADVLKESVDIRNGRAGGNPRLMRQRVAAADNGGVNPPVSGSDIRGVKAQKPKPDPESEREEERKKAEQQEGAALPVRLPARPPPPGASPPLIAAVSQDATAIIAAHREVAIEVFTERLAGNLFPAAADSVHAARWLDAGAKLGLSPPEVLAIARSVFVAVQQRRQRSGQEAAQQLSYFNGPVADALATRATPLPQGNPHVPQSDGRQQRNVRGAVDDGTAGRYSVLDGVARVFGEESFYETSA